MKSATAGHLKKLTQRKKLISYTLLSHSSQASLSSVLKVGMGKKREEKEKSKGRSAREGVRKGAWTPEEDNILVDFITHNGHGTWRNLPKLAGLLRCGKSCRLRWTNYLRPDIKRGPFTPEEENQIINLHGMLGNKWAAIASHLPGRTDNDVKNFWNSHLRKRNHPAPDSAPLPSDGGDYFLRLWNSNVGEAFRTNSQTSSLAKAESSAEVVECKKEAEDEVSGDEMMKLLLLDFPLGANDMGFLNHT